MRRDATRLFAVLEVSIAADSPVRGLSMADQQLVEIAKALSMDARMLIVATLGTMSVYRGFTYLIAGGRQVSLSDLPPEYISLARSAPFGVPLFGLVAVVIVVVVSLVLQQTRFGRQVYAVGSNPEAADILGIRSRWIVFIAFSACGLLAGVAGVLWGARFGTINATAANGVVLQVVAGVVVGGVNIFGGAGTVYGAALGALFLGLIANALTLLHLSQFGLQAIYGAVILTAVAADAVIVRRLQRAAGGVRRRPSLVVTLGSLALFRGLASIVLGPRAISNFPPAFSAFGFGNVPGTAIPWPLVVFAVLAVGCSLVLHRTWLGRHIFAAGKNERAARFSARADAGQNMTLAVVTAVLLAGRRRDRAPEHLGRPAPDRLSDCPQRRAAAWPGHSASPCRAVSDSWGASRRSAVHPRGRRGVAQVTYVWNRVPLLAAAFGLAAATFAPAASAQGALNVAFGVSAADPDAIAPALRAARDAGIKVVGYDSSPAVGAYDVFVNQADTQGIGESLVQMACDEAPGCAGEIAILSATSTAKVLEDTGNAGRVQLTGLGTPNSLKAYVKDGTINEFALWNVENLGYLTYYIAAKLVLGPPQVFDASNIDQFNF